jgi:hypothetical protein
MNPLIPMLALTGSPSNEQIDKMLLSYKTIGIDTVMLYPRAGLEIEYMSDIYFDLIGRILECAKNNDMHIWLYDEFNWPSGSCNNTVIEQDASFAAKRFVYQNGTVNLETMQRGGAQRVFQPFDSDMLNPQAVECFIKLTHERYCDHFKEYFGNVIVGIFTDEPSFIYTANGEGVYPYYDGIFEDYSRASGRELMSDIIAYESGNNVSDFPSIFRTLIGKRFKECFIDRVSMWCKEHNLLLTGHTFCDSAPLSATRETGDWFPFIEQMDVPGIDEIHTEFGTGDEILFSMLENVRFNGKEHAMAELFALGPVSMSFARRKQMLWYAAAHGIDHYFIAISHLDARGNVKKPDFFDNFNYHNPDFEGVRLLAKEAEKTALFAKKRPSAYVGLRVPYTSYLKALGSHNGEKIESAFREIIEKMVSSQVTFRFLRETEETDIPVIFTLNEEGIVEENTKKVYTCVDLAIEDVCQRTDRITVTDKNGSLIKNIRLKTYEDGTIIILDRENMAVGKRECILHIGKDKEEFTLENYGVVIFENGKIQKPMQPQGKEVHLEASVPTLLSDRILRPQFFKENIFKFTLPEPVTAKIHRRIYPDDGGTVLVDGRSIVFDNSCDILTDCFSHLYRSADITLSAGEHTVFCDYQDLSYLPAVLFTGSFPFDGTFFGKLKITAEFQIPKEASRAFVAMEDVGLYVTADICGEKIGENVFAPYYFEIPKQYFGDSVCVTFTFHSSLAPLFGDLDLWFKNGIFLELSNVTKSSPERLDIENLNIKGIIQ